MKTIKQCSTKFIFAVLFCCLLFSCGNVKQDSQKQNVSTSITSVSITDYANRTVTLARPATKIVCMAANSLCVLASLGMLENIVALDKKCFDILPFCIAKDIRPALKDLPNIGKSSSPDCEAIAKLKADLILFSGNAKDADMIQEKTGAKVAVIKSLEGFDFEIYTKIATLVGKEKRAKEVTSFLQRKIQALQTALKDLRQEQIKTAYIVLQSSSGNLFKTMKSNQSLEAANVKNPAQNTTQKAEWGVVEFSKEALIEINPDVIFLDKPLKENDIRPKTLQNDATFSFLQAVKKGNVHYMLSFMLPKDYVYVVLEGFYFANVCYPAFVSQQMTEDAVNDLFYFVYGIKDYYEKFQKTILP